MRGSKTTRVALLAATIAMSACFKDFHLAASNLQIGPNPAAPGDIVVASVFLSVVPLQRYTIRVFVDETEHLELNSSEEPSDPTLITLGDAADLIAAYGLGAHSVHVVVRAEDADRTARTQPVALELRQATP